MVEVGKIKKIFKVFDQIQDKHFSCVVKQLFSIKLTTTPTTQQLLWPLRTQWRAEILLIYKASEKLKITLIDAFNKFKVLITDDFLTVHKKIFIQHFPDIAVQHLTTTNLVHTINRLIVLLNSNYANQLLRLFNQYNILLFFDEHFYSLGLFLIHIKSLIFMYFALVVHDHH